MAEKIGFFICHCGINIADKVRVDEVADYIKGMKDVVVSEHYKFMCSNPGQELIIDSIREFGLTRVVVASCSPRMHEKTFQRACQQAGINPYFFQMASVREQVSWVTKDEDEATKKAKILATAAINRVRFHQALHERTVKIHPDVMVVGGGIAGIQASLDIASSGRKVYLVEKDSTIGGHMLQFDKTFPTLDCAACIGTPKIVEVAQHPNIELLTHSEVKEVSGFIGNFTVSVTKNPRYVIEGKCTGCGDCSQVCPVTRPSEWDVGMADRKAIFRAFPQAVPITYVIDKKGTAPCKATCPAHVSIQGYIAMINQGKYREGHELFMQEHPFPGICGRMCHHPCESICTRGDADQPLGVQYLHRFLADRDLESGSRYVPPIEELREEKIAVIGSGPAGLATAYFLARKGYRLTVFEKLPVKGGMMAVGIPEYRLPRDILNYEIETIEKLGVTINTGVAFGTDITLEGLESEGYKAVFLATGLHGSRRLGVDGEDLTGNLPGVDFLRDVALGKKVAIGKRVIVVGGGNVAIDVALTARRVGGEEITLVCLESRGEMPAWDYEVEDAVAEKVNIINSYGPKKFMEKNHRSAGIVFKRCTRVFDENGAFNPQYDESEEMSIEADTVIIAIGQMAELEFAKNQKIATTRRGGLEVDPLTLQTSIPWVFAGGDVTYGPKSVVEAVECGKEAAESIDRFINSIDLIEDREKEWSYEKPDYSEVHSIPRTIMPILDVENRAGNFKEIALGFSEEAAIGEAQRCLECGICSECYQCVEACQPKAIDHSMKAEEIEVDVGSIIVATGYDLMDPSSISRFGYGTYPNVYTGFEFERLCNATGPTAGKIRIRDDKGELTKVPKSVAILHCVGSRDENYHKYCSRVCCMYALKYAHLIKDKIGHDTEVYDFFIDQRCFGKGYEEFYMKVQNEAINFIRGKPAEIIRESRSADGEDKMTVVVEDTNLGQVLRIGVEMVILCVAMEARDDAVDMSRIFGINVGSDGFFLEEHPKMAPFNTPTDGVFIAGTCQGPKDIPDSISHASGAAAKALALSMRGEITVPSTISYIDPDICIGCKSCIELCPYTAIEFNQRLGISVINEALCKGCGSCAGHCPSSAAQVKHFTGKQIFAEIDGLLTESNRVTVQQSHATAN